MERIRGLERSFSSPAPDKKPETAQGPSEGASSSAPDGPAAAKYSPENFAGRTETAQTHVPPERPAPSRGPDSQEAFLTGKRPLDTQATGNPPSAAPDFPEPPPRAGGAAALPEGMGAPALLAQLERLERAAAVSSAELAGGRQTAPEGVQAPGREGFPLSLPGTGRAASLPDMAGVVEQGLSFGSNREQSGPSPAGALGWAEQADRIFRRDSRRYDGGFYLY